MAGLVLILPILLFDIWLAATVGRRQIGRWRQSQRWMPLGLALGIGLLLAFWLTFVLQYGSGLETRKGFPIPLLFYHPDNKTWSRAAVPAAVFYAGAITNFCTGLAAPFIPSKIAEFLKQVKAEMK